VKTTRHTDRLVRLTRLGAVNAYLVVEDDGLTLVDTMLPGSHDGILQAARELGRQIVRIALTHAHGDHVGSLDRLAAALPEAEVSISARDARLLGGDRTLDPGEPQSKLRGGYPTTATKPGRDLRAVTFLDTSGMRLVVEAVHELDRAGVPFAVVRGGPEVQRLFNLARLDDRLPFFDELDAALAA